MGGGGRREPTGTHGHPRPLRQHLLASGSGCFGAPGPRGRPFVVEVGPRFVFSPFSRPLDGSR